MILTKQGVQEVYSDTKELEQEMLDIARNYPEDLSQDFIADDNRYTVNNTFSSVRRNLLNWYNFKDNASVLEVGAGMGAMTGCLCDKCKHVISLEMSKDRAEVIRSRYPERQNLEIVCEDIFSWSTDEKFDYVIVVGVLEYAAIFGKKYKDPFQTFIDRLKSFLNADGIVLLAIENRFGLKYWCGASEDHICEPFKGIAGYKEDNTAVTFSKYKLNNMFSNAGFENIRFFYVLPDYKFPTLIFTDDYSPGNSAIQKLALNYVKGSRLIYNEEKLYQDIIENHVEDFFANSFLVEASRNDKLLEQPIYVASKGECKKEFRVSTLIYKNGKVEKIAVHEKAKEHIGRIMKYESELGDRGIEVLKSELIDGKISMPFYDGLIAEDYFHQLLSENNIVKIKALFEKLEECLLKSSEVINEGNILWDLLNDKRNYGTILKQGYIDMTLSNCFLKDEKLVFFDQEWMFENIPVKFIIFYSIRQSFLSYVGKSTIKQSELFEILDIKNYIDDFIFLERHIWKRLLYRQEHFYDGDGWYNQYSEESSLIADLDKYRVLENEHWNCKQIIEEKNDIQIKLEQVILEKNNYSTTLENQIKEKNNYSTNLENQIKEKNGYILKLEEHLKQDMLSINKINGEQLKNQHKIKYFIRKFIKK